MNTTTESNNRPVTFTGKPTKEQFQRHLTACPPDGHALIEDYRKMRRTRSVGNDDFGGWVRDRHPGTFRVWYATMLNCPETWEVVWQA